MTLVVSPDRANQLRAESQSWPSWSLLPRQMGDLELLLNGGYGPLKGYLPRAECDRVRETFKLEDGEYWPVPLTLDLPAEDVPLARGKPLALRDPEGVLLAALHVEDFWIDPTVKACGGAALPLHVGGRIEGVQLPVHHDFKEERRAPAEQRERLYSIRHGRVVSLQTDGVLSSQNLEEIAQVCASLEATLLVQAFVSSATPGDSEPYVRIRHLRNQLSRWPGGGALLSVIPYPGGCQGLEDIPLRAMVARNFGASHLLLDAPKPGGDHLKGALACAGITPLVRNLGISRLSPTELHRGGLTVFFTGLSGSGKSTTANVLLAKLLERGHRPVTLLDGDLVRKNLSSELGFSEEHRNLNIRRIGYVASEITKHGGIALCCPIAPYDAVRREVRSMVERVGRFILVRMATPIEVCERRDRKGLYAKARAGTLPSFTGVSDPYQIPTDAEITLDATLCTPEDSAERVIAYLESRGYLVS